MAGSSVECTKARSDFFQTAADITITVYVSGATNTQVSYDTFHQRLMLRGPTLLWAVDLYGKVQPVPLKVIEKKMNIEIKLAKVQLVQWPRLGTVLPNILADFDKTLVVIAPDSSAASASVTAMSTGPSLSINAKHVAGEAPASASQLVANYKMTTEIEMPPIDSTSAPDNVSSRMGSEVQTPEETKTVTHASGNAALQTDSAATALQPDTFTVEFLHYDWCVVACIILCRVV